MKTANAGIRFVDLPPALQMQILMLTGMRIETAMAVTITPAKLAKESSRVAVIVRTRRPRS